MSFLGAFFTTPSKTLNNIDEKYKNIEQKFLKVSICALDLL